jgi:hypothetical protein
MWMRVLDGPLAGEWVNVPAAPGGGYSAIKTMPPGWLERWAEGTDVEPITYHPVRYAHIAWRLPCGHPLILWFLTMAPLRAPFLTLWEPEKPELLGPFRESPWPLDFHDWQADR